MLAAVPGTAVPVLPSPAPGVVAPLLPEAVPGTTVPVQPAPVPEKPVLAATILTEHYCAYLVAPARPSLPAPALRLPITLSILTFMIISARKRRQMLHGVLIIW